VRNSTCFVQVFVVCTWVLAWGAQDSTVTAPDTAAAGQKPVAAAKVAPAKATPDTAQPADTSAPKVESAEAKASAPVDTTVGSLTIRSEPTGALVIMDGFPVGETPIRVDSLTKGKHRLQITAKGYYTKSATVLVEGGVNREAVFTLVQPATLSVVANVPGASVEVDGTDAGVAPARVEELKPGKHEVRVAKTGHTPYSGTVTLASGAHDTLQVALEAVAKVAAKPAEPRRKRRGRIILASTLFGVFALVILIAEIVGD
jgi:hypothetical protein